MKHISNQCLCANQCEPVRTNVYGIESILSTEWFQCVRDSIDPVTVETMFMGLNRPCRSGSNMYDVEAILLEWN